MPATGPGRTPEERFVRYIRELEDRIASLQNRPLQIPYLDADPTTDYAGNIWMFQDGRVRIRLADGTIKELATVASTGATSGTAKPAVAAQTTTKYLTASATFTKSYRQSGGETGGNHTYLYYGDSGESSFNGKQQSIIGFNSGSIAATLAGAIIDKVELYLYNIHTWAGSGSTVYFGVHNNSSAPSTASGIVHAHDFISSGKTHRNTGGWLTLSTEFGSRLRDGTGKGIILQAPNNSRSYYGYAAGVGSGLTIPQIRITYRS